MYDIADVLPAGTGSELSPGTSLLVAGPAMTGKQGLTLDLLAAGLDRTNGLLLVTTNKTASSCLDELERRVPSFDHARVGIVDCSGGNQQDGTREIATQRVSSPGDLTGISIGTAKLMEQFGTHDISSVRHGLVSVSTLLQYLELDTVFKFLHIYTNRIADTQGLGVFTIDTGSHDSQTLNTIRSEFDAIVELRETDSGEREVRVRGIPDAATGWQPF